MSSMYSLTLQYCTGAIPFAIFGAGTFEPSAFLCELPILLRCSLFVSWYLFNNKCIYLLLECRLQLATLGSVSKNSFELGTAPTFRTLNNT